MDRGGTGDGMKNIRFCLCEALMEESKAFLHKWPRNYRFWAKVSPAVFHFVCRLYARWERTWFQIRVVARRPNN